MTPVPLGNDHFSVTLVPTVIVPGVAVKLVIVGPVITLSVND
jgi:hypothetical protein